MLLSEPGPIHRHPLAAADRPDPTPRPHEIVLDIASCAVCRTDLQIAAGDLPARSLPIIPGHQAVGRVAAVGSAVTDWVVGDRAGVGWVAETCGECRFCKSGRENLCERARFTGWDRNGGFATKMAVTAGFALRVPAGPADEAIAPLLCGGIIGYRALRVAGVIPGSRLGLFGFGASALIAIQVAVHWGCEVYVMTRSIDEQHRAREFGAVWAGSYTDEIPVRLDAAVTFAPVGDVVIRALRVLERGGVVAINAIHLDRIPSFDYNLLWLERQVRSVANYTRHDAAELLELAARIPIRTVVDPYPLEQANTALEAIRTGAVAGAAVLSMD